MLDSGWDSTLIIGGRLHYVCNERMHPHIPGPEPAGAQTCPEMHMCRTNNESESAIECTPNETLKP